MSLLKAIGLRGVWIPRAELLMIHSIIYRHPPASPVEADLYKRLSKRCREVTGDERFGKVGGIT
jgi:hypothetical protein